MCKDHLTLDLDPAPSLILQWRDTWTIEDAIGWILKGDERESLKDLQSRINREFTSIEEFIKLFKVKEGSGRLKADYLAFEDVASVIGSYAFCRDRVETLLRAITRVCLEGSDESPMIERDNERSNENCTVFTVVAMSLILRGTAEAARPRASFRNLYQP